MYNRSVAGLLYIYIYKYIYIYIYIYIYESVPFFLIMDIQANLHVSKLII